MSTHDQILSIIDSIRDDFDVLGAFAFSQDGPIPMVNDSFWRVVDAAIETKKIIEQEFSKLGQTFQSPVDWSGIEGFRFVTRQAGLPAMMANVQLYSVYTMQLNQFFIQAQSI